MENKIHLFYGIIIGVLGCASVGSSTDDQKDFKEIHLVEYEREGYNKKYAEENGKFKDHPQEFLDNGPLGMSAMVSGFKLTTKGYDEPEAWIVVGNTPNDLRKAGWTILDMELNDDDEAYYLIGR